MDFGSAVLLIGIVFAVTEFVKGLVPDIDSRLTQLIVMGLGIGLTFLVASSDWGPKQVIDGIPLDTMNGSTLLLVGLAIGSGATVLDRGVKAVRNIGQNDTSQNVPAGQPDVN